MIPARKSPLGQSWVWWLIDHSLRKYFDRIFFRMRYMPSAEEKALPIIACANHFSWWDGYIAAIVERQLKVDNYLMMEEAQLKRYSFFTWAGCFSVDRHDPRSVMQSLHYAARLLKERPGRMVWLFPQGELFPNDRRPLVFLSGALHLARMAYPVLLYPVAARIEYMGEQRPGLFISLGAPMQVNEAEVRASGFLKVYTRRLEELVTAELDQLRADVLACDYTSFTQIVQGRPSAHRIFDMLLLRKQLKRQ